MVGRFYRRQNIYRLGTAFLCLKFSLLSCVYFTHQKGIEVAGVAVVIFSNLFFSFSAGCENSYRLRRRLNSRWGCASLLPTALSSNPTPQCIYNVFFLYRTYFFCPGKRIWEGFCFSILLVVSCVSSFLFRLVHCLSFLLVQSKHIVSLWGCGGVNRPGCIRHSTSVEVFCLT
jgi:hypothetical protein